MKYSKLSLKDIDNASKEALTDQAIPDYIPQADSIAADLQLNIFPDQNDAAIIFYVSGYCCRSLVNCNKCHFCKETTVADVEEISGELDPLAPTSAIEFFRDINRGGLWKPNLETFKIGALCWQVFAELSKSDLKNRFLTCQNQRFAFEEIINIVFYEKCSDYSWSIATMCANGHNILEGISKRFFNCMIKNLMRNLREEDSSKSSRKIRKLTSV